MQRAGGTPSSCSLDAPGRARRPARRARRRRRRLGGARRLRSRPPRRQRDRRAAPIPTTDPGLENAGPAPEAPATDGVRGAHPASGGAGAVSRATALPNGVALPPLEAPDAVRQIIEAGNAIARTPYLWGGGHGRWLDKGYDCSGSVSFVLASAGLLGGPLDSGHLMSWGKPGPGRWVTIYANAGHVFLEVAGIRFDTSAQRVTGSRWAPDGRSTAGFVARHPAGL